ncbi:MAG: transporter substrate-binding domain-containing protein [Spirochaetes bacterium]|nr:transporter substrate-binding domain-containing protein [Spirochaetota bacterium]
MKKLYIVFLLFIPLSINAGKNSLKVATPEWVNQTNGNGTGLYFEIIKAVFEPEGFTVEYAIVPWPRAEYMVKTGESDVMPGDIKTETNNFIYPDQIFLNEITSTIFKKNKIQWLGKSSLQNRKCIWLTGYNYQKTLGEKVTWFEIDNREAAVKAILADRSDFYIDAKIDISYYFRKHPEQKNLFEFRDIYSVDIYLKFSNNARGKHLSDLYDKRVKKLKNDRKFREIFKKYNYDFPVYK